MIDLFEREASNPIVRPGRYPWRQAVAFNPAVARDPSGRFHMWERVAGNLRPFQCAIGALVSNDGVHFEHRVDRPVFTPAMAGCEHGSVQDPRVVRLDGRWCMTFAFRPYAWNSSPTGVGVPESWQADYPGFDGDETKNQTRSGVAVSDDGIDWQLAGWVSGPDLDDRNVILFPEKIGGRYAALRRPQGMVATDTSRTDGPTGIWLSYSDDLASWTEPRRILPPAFAWESNRIGGSTPPIRTDAGWLVLYHGVEDVDPARRGVCYRLGAAMLDADDLTRTLARCPEPIMEPRHYYEKVGLYIPNVIFPTAAVVVDGVVHLYYGCCDTAIGLARCPLERLVEHVMRHPA